MTRKLFSICDRTLTELLIGIIILGIICQAIGVFLVKDISAYSIGLWAGILVAVLLALHMWRTLDRAFCMSEKDASKLLATAYLIRYAFVILVLGLLMVSGFANPLSAFLGVMCLKVAAYIQPFTHKISSKLFHEM